MSALRLERDGAELFAGASVDCLASIRAALRDCPADRAGVRLKGIAALREHLGLEGCIGSVARHFLGDRARPVRAILFDKTAAQNWQLGWHQDRTICVAERREVIGFEPWSTKAGMPHVEPPFAIIERMVTLRAHLDDVPATNAPLLIVVGSHLLGRIPTTRIDRVVESGRVEACLARAGDVWAYRTAIVHASKSAEASGRRRVLQIDYSADSLPGGLEWAGL